MGSVLLFSSTQTVSGGTLTVDGGTLTTVDGTLATTPWRSVEAP
jgi:hypothetical protein